MKCLHGISQDVTSGCLHDVFHELWTVGVNAIPFLSGDDTLIGDAGRSEAVLTELWFYVS